MEIMKIFSDAYDEERLYSVLLTEDEMDLYQYMFSDVSDDALAAAGGVGAVAALGGLGYGAYKGGAAATRKARKNIAEKAAEAAKYDAKKELNDALRREALRRADEFGADRSTAGIAKRNAAITAEYGKKASEAAKLVKRGEKLAKLEKAVGSVKTHVGKNKGKYAAGAAVVGAGAGFAANHLRKKNK